MLDKRADLPVSATQRERVSRRVGAERGAARAAESAACVALPLVEAFAGPAGVTPPALAVVMAGGRMQIRGGPGAAAAAPAAGTATASAAEAWVEEAATTSRSGHRREDKVGLLLTMTSDVAPPAPCPGIPASFLDVVRIPGLVRALNKHVKGGEDAVTDGAEPGAAADAWPAGATYEPPVVQHRQVVASRQRWPTLAPLPAQAAWALGSQGAARKVFVGAGAATNWALPRRCFGSFVPVLDFSQALSYVFAAALAGRRCAAGWAVYQPWIGWVWPGRVAAVIAAREGRRAEPGPPAAGEPGTSPRRVVAQTLTDLRHHRDEMR